MRLGELLDLWRREIDDVAQPYLWADTEAMEYADDAQREAARRGRLFVDSTTQEVCEIALTANTAVYALDPRVIRVNRARIDGEALPLQFCMVRDLDRRAPGWEDWEGEPQFIVPDWESGKLRLVGVPQADGVLRLTVVRLPLVRLNDLEDVLEVREETQRNLRHWMSFRAYSKRDSEAYDKDKAMESLALFEREFGKPQPAYDELWAQQYYAEDLYLGRY